MLQRLSKLKPLIFSVSGFRFSDVANVFVFIILYDFCLLSAQCRCVVINVRRLETYEYVQPLDRYAPTKFTNGEKNFVLQGLQFQKVGSAANSQAGQAYFIVKFTLLATVSQSDCLGFNNPSGHTARFYYCQTGADLLIWGAHSDDRMDLQFKTAIGHCQGSHSLVRVPRESRP
jgi:hypothetical protein